MIPNWRLGSTLEQPLSDDGGPSAPSTKDDGRRRRTNMANSSRNGRIISRMRGIPKLKRFSRLLVSGLLLLSVVPVRGRRARARSERVAQDDKRALCYKKKKGRIRPGNDRWIRDDALSSSNARSSATNVRDAVTDARSSISTSWL